MKKLSTQPLSLPIVILGICATLVSATVLADDSPGSASTGYPAPGNSSAIPAPQLLGAQFTLIRQHLDPFDAPYAGPLSLINTGATNSTYTGGVSLGWEPVRHTQLYLDMEKFIGAGVSGDTGLASLTNGDAVRAGQQGLPAKPYVARSYVRFLLPLAGSQEQQTTRAEDQLATFEPDRHVELKLGIMAANDDFDQNRYANGTRTQFENWSLINDTAWDFAADTRGYTTGGMLAYVSGPWTARLGIYKMPKVANAQPLAAITQARGQNAELDWAQPGDNGIVLRLLAYQNVANMGDYNEAIEQGLLLRQTPDIVANDARARHKNGFAFNLEKPLADGGETGLFARLGANDGHTESFAYTEMDRMFSTGLQIDGVHWGRAEDRLAIAYVMGGLSAAHRSYLELGGQGFTLGDGQVNYGFEQVLETYYRLEPVHGVQISPDYQYIVNPGFNRDRGPVQVYGIRLHLEY